MTAPDARQNDELREALSREAGSHAFRWVQQHPGWLARCLCREWEELVTDEDQATAIHRRWRLHAADALVPVVTAWAEEQARARAAEELVVLASRLIAHDVEDPVIYEEIRALRAALTADDRTDPA